MDIFKLSRNFLNLFLKLTPLQTYNNLSCQKDMTQKVVLSDANNLTMPLQKELIYSQLSYFAAGIEELPDHRQTLY